jgi:hypothetical protein
MLLPGHCDAWDGVHCCGGPVPVDEDEDEDD